MAFLKSFHFGPIQIVPGGAFITTIPKGVRQKSELLTELQRALMLPDYFGHNWDALDECLRDFHWIGENSVILIHGDVPLLDDSERKLYLEILSDAIGEWKNYQDHDFIVAFPLEAEAVIRSLKAV